MLFNRDKTLALLLGTAGLMLAAIAVPQLGMISVTACVVPGVMAFAAATWLQRPDWRALLMRAIESTPAGLCIFDAESRVLLSNTQFAAMYGLTQAQVKPGRTFGQVFESGLVSFAPSRRLDYIDDFNQLGSVHQSVHKLRDGRIVSVARHPMAGGGLVEVHRDITSERSAEERANDAMQALLEKQYAIDQAVIVAITDVEGNITYANDSFCTISEYSRQELIGQNHRILNSGAHPRELFREMYRTLAKGQVWRGELCNRSKSGRLYWVDTVITPQLGPEGKPISYMAIRIDITTKKEAQAQVSFAATHDALTGLLNRSALFDLARTKLPADDRLAWLSIHLIDLDGFKAVNDTLGHNAGDNLLRQVALRLRSLTAEEDFVARLGGDEFAVVRCAPGPAQESGMELSNRIVEAMAEPFELDEARISISASIGIALYPEHGSKLQDLLRKADLALYEVKAEGRNGIRLYRPAMLEALETEKAIETKLRNALAAGQFELHYQPILDVETRTTRAAEALVRWRHPTEGLIPPTRFIPVAERTGLILPLSEWIIHQACQDAATWPGNLRVAVNVSAMQFKRGSLFECVMQALFRSGLNPRRLQIEVTETALLEHQTEQLQTFRQLKNMGVALVLDDFGTGYSSASYVTDFPFDAIKIDKSFVQGFAKRECAAVIASAVALAKGLGIAITAEGIETELQFQALRSMGVDFAQGYLFSPPVPDAEFTSMQANGHELADCAPGELLEAKWLAS